MKLKPSDVYQEVYAELYGTDCKVQVKSSISEEEVAKRLAEMDGQVSYHEDYPEDWDSFEPTKKIDTNKCECGADKCELPYHSAWCPKASEGL